MKKFYVKPSVEAIKMNRMFSLCAGSTTVNIPDRPEEAKSSNVSVEDISIPNSTLQQYNNSWEDL